MRVLITGAAGFLGKQAALEFSGRNHLVYPLTRKELDITSQYQVKSALIDIRPHLVINFAAYTDVDRAETEKEEAFTINGLGPLLLASACRMFSSTLVHISTDYVFNGLSPRPYLVSDTPDPINVYGQSKLLGEQAVRESGCRYYIIRTSWLFGPGGKNFATTILKLARERSSIKVIDDQRACPTYVPDLARGIADLSATGITGTYHLTNSGSATRYEFAKTIIEAASLKTKIEPCSSAEFPTPARRPVNSALNPFPTLQVQNKRQLFWEERVKTYIKDRSFPHMEVSKLLLPAYNDQK
ncbi:MAG: dTDP-4-dehydrorhamnose reductase [Peptococcaceae bacterium BICA1-7]|nr:MAG: dTDP-4-dehydrorhamnose reductase [Peptococcaceae bacterium BICA1-7]HBV96302.1 dTDP-4-dehydrorhamnose reductase [Desulfotomaculum sp.]